MIVRAADGPRRTLPRRRWGPLFPGGRGGVRSSGMATALQIRPTLRPRLLFLVTGTVLLAMAAGLWVLLAARWRLVLDPDGSGVGLGTADLARITVLVIAVLVAAASSLIGVWSWWALVPRSQRMQLTITEGECVWRPFIGWPLRFSLADVRRVEEYPVRRWRGGHLAVWWGRRRTPLRLYRQWYLPLDYRAARRALRAAAELPADAAG